MPASTPEPDRPVKGLGRVPLIGSIVTNPAFRDADFRRLSCGVAFNNAGMSGEHVVLGILVFQATQSTAWVGITLALYNFPMLIFGLLSGAVADWLDRRTLLRCLEAAIAATQTLFAMLIALGVDDLWLIMAFTATIGSLRAIHQPVRVSYAYDIVGGDHIVAGLGALNLATRFGQLGGALITGAVLQNIGAPAAILLLVAGHVGAYAMFTRLRSVGHAAPLERAPILQNLREYRDELRANRILLVLLAITAAVEIFGFSFSTAMPELATARFAVGAQGLGYMHAARAVGGILAGLVLAGMGGLRRRGAVFLVVIYGFGASLLLLAVADQFMLALAALVFVAVLATASDVLTQSMMQLSVPNALRGRAMGSWVFAIGSAPLGHLMMGALAVTFGVGVALGINGALLIGVGVLATFVAPRLRRL